MHRQTLPKSFPSIGQSILGRPTPKDPRIFDSSGREITAVERLHVTLTGANIHDKRMVGATLDAALIYGSRGPQRPQHICLDKGYDYDDCEQEARERCVKPHIRRRGEPPLIGFVRGKPRRWVVEPTNSWHNNLRGLRIRWERKAERHGPLVNLVCAIITVRATTRQIHRP
jgi:putative transposase